MVLRILAVAAAVTLSAQDQQIILEKEAALGAMLARDFNQQATTLDSPAFNKYMERVGSKLSAQLGHNQPEYTFGLVADKSVGRNPRHEAVSFPGGYIFFPAGLVSMAADETEFVGRIAHAMAHTAVLRQARVRNPRDPNQATIPLIYMGGKFGVDGSDELIPMNARTALHEREVAAEKLTVQITSGYSAGTASSEDEFLNMQAEVRSIVAARAPRPPSLLNPH